MGTWNCTCCGACWGFHDHFNRAANTNVGSDWNEVSGDWEIADSGYGDANPHGEAPPLCQLHEEYETAIGEGGTSGAKIIGTKPEPADSAGQQNISVNVQEPVAGDVYWIYPCCTDTSTTGAVSVKFTYNGGVEWLIEFGAVSKTVNGTKFTTGMVGSYGFFKLWVCADHAQGQVKAHVIGTSYPAWDDAADPGTGRYYGLGHSNTSTGAVFDDFEVTELWHDTLSCSQCWCRCLNAALTKHLYAEVMNATNRSACLEGIGWPMTYLDGPGDPDPNHWLGTAEFPRYDTGTQDVLWHLNCATADDDDPANPGANLSLWTGEFDGGCTQMHMGDLIMTPDPDQSSCDPLELWFGPYHMSKGELDCLICYAPMQPPSGDDQTGEFWIVVTEA